MGMDDNGQIVEIVLVPEFSQTIFHDGRSPYSCLPNNHEGDVVL